MRFYTQAKDTAQTLSGAPPQDVLRLGQGAYWAGGRLNQLNVLYLDRSIIITIFGLSSDDKLGLARDAASRILQKL